MFASYLGGLDGAFTWEKYSWFAGKPLITSDTVLMVWKLIDMFLWLNIVFEKNWQSTSVGIHDGKGQQFASKKDCSN